MTRARSASVAGATSRRLACRRLGQGSGNRTKTRPIDPCGSQRSSGRASSACSRTFCVPRCLDRAQRLHDAVLERLAADEADVGMLLGLPQQMLAAAETDLEPYVSTCAEQAVSGAGGGVVRSRLRRGRTFTKQACLPRAELAAPPATERAQVGACVSVPRLATRGSRRQRTRLLQASRRGRSSPTRSRLRCPARGRSARRPTSWHRSGLLSSRCCGCRAGSRATAPPAPSRASPRRPCRCRSVST